MSDNNKRTITLTRRPPVRVTEENWPLIASADHCCFDHEYKSQANRISDWFVGVRQHSDGRAIIYATYQFRTNCRGEECRAAKRGILVGPVADLAAAIEDVAYDIACQEHHDGDEARWARLAEQCVADLPAVDLD